MHHDIRWDNVLKEIEKDTWFIIDFDDACIPLQLFLTRN